MNEPNYYESRIGDLAILGVALAVFGLTSAAALWKVRETYVAARQNDPELLSAARPAPALPAKSNPALPRIQIPAPK